MESRKLHPSCTVSETAMYFLEILNPSCFYESKHVYFNLDNFIVVIDSVQLY
jgi:hypothetical protein